VAAFGRASVVLVDFPFSDLSQTKLRPAIVLAQANSQDWFLCQITSNARIDERAIEIKDGFRCRLFASKELRTSE
jgi:mRNA interferase MazF